MKLKVDGPATPDLSSTRIVAPVFAALTLVLTALATVTPAQAQAADSKASEAKPRVEIYQTLYITNLTAQNDLSEVMTDLRNMTPGAKLFGLPSQGAISIRGTAEEIAQAQKIVADLDRARKVYRLAYTIAESDGGKRIGTQRYTLIAVSGERTALKQGSRVPIVTGTSGADAPGTQVQYQDVGLHIEATINGHGDGLRLRTKVEQSSLADEKPGVGVQDPVLHQTLLEGEATLAAGKPLVLGSLDIPGTTRRQEIEVVSELVQ